MGSCSCFFAAREAFLKFNNETRYRWLIDDFMMLSWKENLEIRQLSEKTLKNASSALLILTLDYEVYFVRQYSLSLIIWNLTIHFIVVYWNPTFSFISSYFYKLSVNVSGIFETLKKSKHFGNVFRHIFRWIYLILHQPHKMVKHTQTIRRPSWGVGA